MLKPPRWRGGVRGRGGGGGGELKKKKSNPKSMEEGQWQNNGKLLTHFVVVIYCYLYNAHL